MEQNTLEAWKDIVAARRQYDCWDLSRPVEHKVVLDIVDEMHQNCAKKQNRPFIKLVVLDWSDPVLRNALFDYTRFADPKKGYRTVVNPQMLAHYVILFVNVSLYDEHKAMLGDISTGLHANYIAHAATARGLQTGFCQCSERDQVTDEQYEYMLAQLGIDDFEQIYLMMGLGHGVPGSSMTNPYTGESVVCWSRTDQNRDAEPLDVEDYVEFKTASGASLQNP